MNALLARPALEDHPFLNGVPGPFLQELASFSDEIQFEPGQVLVQQGSYADKLFLIIDGQVGIYFQPQPGLPSILLETVAGGGVVGWSWLFPPFFSHFTARAITAGKALRLKGSSLLVHAEEHPQFGYILMRRVVTQLLHRLQALEQQVATLQAQQAG